MRLMILAAGLLAASLTAAQEAAPLGESARQEVVRTVCERLEDTYVLPDVGLRMSACIKQKLAHGGYAAITDPVALADALTSDLQAVQHDGHLLLRYAPQQAPPADPAPAEDRFARIKEANFGLRKVEVLRGNIGYIDIAHFWADSTYGRASVQAAMRLVSYTHALIIDLRTCGGGSQDAVRDLAGFFFAAPTHLNDMVDRARDDTTRYWTRPDTAFASFASLPLYILTSRLTFSAAEEFCYDLQARGRGTIIGERTGGGAHGTQEVPVGHGLLLALPYSKALNPVTGSNWEGTGVVPDVDVEAAKALGEAQRRILDARLATATDEGERFDLAWDRDLLVTANTPVVIDTATLRAFAGVYGARTFTLENGRLYYQRTGRPKFELEPMSPTRMKAVGNDYFTIEFVRNAQGVVDRVIVNYQDRRVESSMRSAP